MSADSKLLSEEFLKAVGEGDFNAVERYIALGVDVNSTIDDESKNTALHLAADLGNTKLVELIKSLRARPVDEFHPINWQPEPSLAELLIKDVGLSENEKAELSSLIEHRPDLLLVLLLVEAGANLSAQNCNKETPLHCAMRNGDVYMMRLLFSYLDVATLQKEINDFLIFAIRKAPMNVINDLIYKQAAFLIIKFQSESPAVRVELLKNIFKGLLAAAIEEHRTDVVKLCLKAMNELNLNIDKMAYLHHAAKYGNVGITKALITQENHVDIKDGNERTPLLKAAYYGQVDVVKLLLLKKADLHTPQMGKSTTVLHEAVNGNSIEVVRLLLAKGSDVNTKNMYGHTPLHWAATKNRVDIAKLLIENGADVNARDQCQQTPLHAAVEPKEAKWVGMEVIETKIADTSSIGMVELLRKSGSNIHAEDRKGITPLDLAVARNDQAAVELLLLHKSADVNAIPNQKSTQGSLKEAQIYGSQKQDMLCKMEERARAIATLRGANPDSLKKVSVELPIESRTNRNKKKPILETRQNSVQPESFIKIHYSFKNGIYAQNFFTRLQETGSNPSRIGQCNVSVSYPAAIMQDEETCRQYCARLEEEKNKKNTPQSIVEKTSKSSPPKKQPVAAPQTDVLPPMLKQDAPSSIGAILYCKEGPLNDEDKVKEQARNPGSLFLCKIEQQLKLCIYYNNQWHEIDVSQQTNWLGKARKILEPKELKKLTFEKELKFEVGLKNPSVNILKENICKHIDGVKTKHKIKESHIAPTAQQPLIPLQPNSLEPPIIKQQKGANVKKQGSDLTFFSGSSSQQPVLKASLKKVAVAASDTGGSLTVLNTGGANLSLPPKKSTPSVGELQPSGYQRVGRSNSSTRYNLDGQPLDGEPKAKSKTKTKEKNITAPGWANKADSEVLKYFKKMNIEKDITHRAIYYGIIRALVNQEINKEKESRLWDLRNFLVHVFYRSAPWQGSDCTQKFLLDLAESIQKGEKPSCEIPPNVRSSISAHDNNFVEIMNRELAALKYAFKPFKDKAQQMAFFSSAHYPEFLGSCYASVIIMAECYSQLKKQGATFSADEEAILNLCKSQIRNKAVHESITDTSQSTTSDVIDAPVIEELVLYRACQRLFELKKDFRPTLSGQRALEKQEVPSSSTRSHCSTSQGISRR